MTSDQRAETRDNHLSAGNEHNFLFTSTQSALFTSPGDVSQYELNAPQMLHETYD